MMFGHVSVNYTWQPVDTDSSLWTECAKRTLAMTVMAGFIDPKEVRKWNLQQLVIEKRGYKQVHFSEIGKNNSVYINNKAGTKNFGCRTIIHK